MYGRDELLLGFPRKQEEVKSEIKDYYGAISYLDNQIGRIIDNLKKSGDYDNTIIIFAGDNGLALGQHGLMGKQNLYEATVGVPMLWTGPGISKNMVSSAYCYLTDIYPTLCDVLNIDRPDTVEGDSFARCLTNPDEQLHKELFFGFADIQRAVSDTHYKLIEYNVDGVRHTQLYDLEKDPWEMKNLADEPDFQSIKTELRNKLVAYKKTSDDDSSFWDGF